MASTITPLTSTDANLDISIKLLKNIFGEQWTSPTDIGNAGTVLFELLSMFNYLVLTLVVMSFIWTAMIASANTANEGTPLGQKFSTMWVPIRAALGVSFLVPVIGGLSMFQVFLLQGVEYSIDVANMANTKVHERFFKDVPSGIVAMEEIPGLKANALETGGIILKALVLQEYYAQKEDVSTEGGIFTINDVNGYVYSLGGVVSDQVVTEKIFALNGPNFPNMVSKYWRASTMPAIEVSCDEDDGGQATCTARSNALGVYANNLVEVAESVVSQSLPTPTGLDNVGQVDAFLTATNAYITASKKITMDALQTTEAGKDITETMNAFYNSGAAKKGWLSLGAYYWVGSNAMSKTMQAATDLPTPEQPYFNDLKDFMFSNGDLDALFDKSDRLVLQADNTKAVRDSIDKKDGFLGVYTISDTTVDMLTNWMAGTNSGSDVITSMQNIGHWLILGCNTIVTATLKMEISDSNNEDGSGSSFLGGSGNSNDGDTSAFSSILGKLMKGSIAALLILYPLGFTLAYLLPAIPLVIWVMASINWVISVLSLVVGATVWSAAISLPEGDGVAGNHGREGFMLLANCLLRPFLMVFGFVVSFLLVRFLGGFLQEIFSISADAMNGQYSRGLVTVIATVGIFGMIVMVAAQKVYGLIVHFPDIILSYVGKHLPGSGENGDHQKIEGMFRSLGAKGGGFLGGGQG